VRCGEVRGAWQPVSERSGGLAEPTTLAAAHATNRPVSSHDAAHARSLG